jgi:hypothetical protein
MKRILLGFVILFGLFSCKDPFAMVEPIRPSGITQTKTETQIPKPKVGMYVDSVWFAKNYDGYKQVTIHWFGHGDFNKDGLKDIVCVFASNGTQEYNFQNNLNTRIVVGVFISKKTYFELDTNLVYSQLGGWNGVNVADVNKDGYLDIYQMTGGWEGSPHPRPSYYTSVGDGAMDSFLFINQNNKSFKKIIAPVNDVATIATSIFFDNDNNGYSEIYLSNGDYYDFNGVSLIHKKLNIVKSFKGKTYDLRVVTPKYADKKYGLIFLASDNFSDTYFVLKLVGNNLIPIIKYDVPFTKSGFTDGTNGERDEMYIEDLDKDGLVEYIIPSQIFNTSTTHNTPYLLIIDSNGNNVTSKFLDSSINNPLKPEQFNGQGRLNVTGFIYHTFVDMDGDGIKEIFSATGLGYLENGKTYYFKLINGKYTKVLYHNSWIGNVNINDAYINYWPLNDEKNGITVFHVGYEHIKRIIVKTVNL